MVIKHRLVEHWLSAPINNIAVSIDQVASLVNNSIPLVNELAHTVSLKNRIAERVHFKVTLDVLHIEFGVGEDLRKLAILQVSVGPLFLAELIDYVTFFVNQVAFLVDSSTKIVDEMVTVTGLDRHDISDLILVEVANKIEYIKPSSAVVEQTMDIAVVLELLPVHLLAAEFVSNMTTVR